MINDLWYENAVIYCLSVGTFMDAKGDGIGDFHGLVRRLDYLHGLGVTANCLMPFQPSAGVTNRRSTSGPMMNWKRMIGNRRFEPSKLYSD